MADDITWTGGGGYATDTIRDVLWQDFQMYKSQNPTARMFASPMGTRPTHVGRKFEAIRYNELDDSTVTAAKTPADELTDPDSVRLPATSSVFIEVNEYIFLMKDSRLNRMVGLGDINWAMQTEINRHCMRTINSQATDALMLATNKTYPEPRTAENQIVAKTDKLNSSMIRKSATLLETRLQTPWFGSGGKHVLYAHPLVLHDVREESGALGWREPQIYGGSQAALNTGVLGTWENTSFISNTHSRITTTGASSAKVFHSLMICREGLGEEVLTEPAPFEARPVDAASRIYRQGWYGVYGFALWHDEAVQQVLSSALLADYGVARV